ARQRVNILEPADKDGAQVYQDFTHLPLKPDHDRRPVWVCPNGRIFLEAFNPMYKQAYDFLVAIAEPVARPEFVHEYKLTPYSLYAAVAVAITTDSILAVLDRLSKNRLPDQVTRFIRDCTLRYGKAKLVLKRNKYYVESAHAAVLKELLGNPPSSGGVCDLPPREEEEDGFAVAAAPQEAAANLEF
ncbi:unnamed protein product, partial [Heterosigma akashiwo]